MEGKKNMKVGCKKKRKKKKKKRKKNEKKGLINKPDRDDSSKQHMHYLKPVQ